MSIHIAPSTSCNLGCTYCYEEPDREMREEDMVHHYDMDKIMERLEQWNQKYPDREPGFHGGEPMLMKHEDMRQIFSWIDRNYDNPSPHIQTNGTKITDRDIEMFREFNVHVGISLDGPPELNEEREARRGGDDVTDKMSVQTGRAITRLRSEGVSVGLIVVLSETNAGTDEKIDKLLSWMDNMNRMDVSGHYNPAIPYEDVQTDISLDPAQLKKVYIRTWEWMMEEEHRRWNPMRQYQDNLLGARLGNCVNNKCDVYNAGAAKIVKGNGETTGCGKTWSTVGDGVPFLQGDSSDNEYNNSDERYEMLKEVPKEEGGCKGCKYWNVCQGGCPAAGAEDDYRNKTVWCEAKYALYERIEQDMRKMMPQIRMITDLPWNAEIADIASSGQLDIKPFANMRPDSSARPSVHSETRHQHKNPDDYIPDENMPQKTWEEIKEEHKEKYNEEDLQIDDENQYIHADSNTKQNKGWEKVE